MADTTVGRYPGTSYSQNTGRGEIARYQLQPEHRAATTWGDSQVPATARTQGVGR
ncbi:hypothetical protein DPMN_037477 [Dreissena polymorpha]|uniref:Uncharacterized protein n=1 Tax=Dreissena polymorpha TaxID=45954 RepID=A0A9D4MBF7_DREPO|nr:hypothetical protein DPMN_037477 [Dreissena polymorpha]